MELEFQCKVFGCGGRIDRSVPVTLQVGCDSFSSDFYPCTECGRIHCSDGFPTNNRQGYPVFLVGGVPSLLHQPAIQVFIFETERDLVDHKVEKAKLLGEISSLEQLDWLEQNDGFLGYYDPKRRKWIKFTTMWNILK